VPRDSGTLTPSAISAIDTVPNRTAATPNVWVSGDHACVVKNDSPVLLRAVLARSERKTPTASMISTVTVPAASTDLWKSMSPKECLETTRRGTSSNPSAGCGAGLAAGASMAGPGWLGIERSLMAAPPRPRASPGPERLSSFTKELIRRLAGS